jgi:hypothetical protein
MRYWVGVVSVAHTEIGVEGGFCQFNHGKRAPVARMEAGDRFAIYSPKQEMKAGLSVQAFTAIGEVMPAQVYQVEYKGFRPFRRDAVYFVSSHASIRPLLEKLEFTKDRKASWGQVLRRGFFEISAEDFELIATAMAATKFEN